jgi:AcrR family transcriptional regulator
LHERASAAAADAAKAESYLRLSPGPGRSAAAVEADQRERIRRALVEIAAEDGYQTATVRRVARLARVSTETFYELYDGRDDLLVSTYAVLMERCRGWVVSSRSPALRRPGQLRLALGSLFAGLAADPAGAHLALVDVFAGGPAAIDLARREEATLARALKRCLDRRGETVSPVLAGWVGAGALRVARTRTMAGWREPAARTLEGVARWGLAHLEQGTADTPTPRAFPRLAARKADPVVSGPGEDRPPVGITDRDLVFGALAKLARRDGYWSLTMSGLSRASGVPAARIRRRIGSVEACYLAAVRGIVTGCFDELVHLRTPAGSSWSEAVLAAVTAACSRVAEDPGLARLALSGIAEPGLPGLRCRERLVGELAAGFRRGAPHRTRPTRLSAEATVAALWATIAAEVERGNGGRISATAPTYAELVLAPSAIALNQLDRSNSYETSASVSGSRRIPG